MGFDIARTPTIQAVATQDEQQLAVDLQQRLEAAVRQAEEQAEVGEAMETHRKASERLGKLRRAERALSQYTRETGERMSELREKGLNALIEAAAAGERPEFKPFSEVSTLEARSRFASRAIEALVETLIPEAHLVEMREEAHAELTRARALERVAQERAEKLLGQLREAVSEEVVLPVDMSKGVSGALLAYAAEHKARAVQISENADRLEASISGRRQAETR
jgi:hypothetical protein